MSEIRVLISGSGRMGTEMLAGLTGAAGVVPVGVVDRLATPGRVPLPGALGDVPIGTDPEAIVRETHPDVVVDFTFHEWTAQVMPALVDAGVRPVIGTSGLSEAQVAEIESRCRTRGIGGVWASNFAIGAVLMMHFARLAAPHYGSAEVIELHHDGKVDAPSGTALATARAMEAARGGTFTRQEPSTVTIPGTRGGAEGGVSIHSVRLPGLVAHQEVIFGGAGELLTIRHDSLARSSFLPGVLLAVRSAMARNEFVRGLEPLLGL
ncbi:MAG: 4-hydroxy-tetrahydrodipicolinate reductase [Dehalococcoidia bacterium]